MRRICVSTDSLRSLADTWLTHLLHLLLHFRLSFLNSDDKRWERRWSSMWTLRSFTQQITSEIQKRSLCFGRSSQFATASSLLLASLRPVSLEFAWALRESFARVYWRRFHYCQLLFLPSACRMGGWSREWDWRPHWALESVREKWDEWPLRRKAWRHDGYAVDVVSGESH